MLHPITNALPARQRVLVSEKLADNCSKMHAPEKNVAAAGDGAVVQRDDFIRDAAHTTASFSVL